MTRDPIRASLFPFVAAALAALALNAAAPAAAGIAPDQPAEAVAPEHDRFYVRAVLRYLADAQPLIVATRDTARSCEAAVRERGRAALHGDEACRMSMAMVAEFERMRQELAPHVSRVMGAGLDHVMGERDRDLVLAVTAMVKEAQMAYQALARSVAGAAGRRGTVAEPAPGLSAGKETHLYR